MKETISVSANLDQVWPFVSDPVGQATWNEKIIDVRRKSHEPLQLGEQFGITYRMSGRERDANVEVIVCNPPHEVQFRHQYRWKSQNRYAIEKYSMQQQGNLVQVVQEIDLRDAGIPWFLRPLVWFLNRYGKPVGQTTMESLKEVIEASVSSADTQASSKQTTNSQN
ncbi:MAG: SRPBCC family protein [Planctomycetales bacterium]|nr:SRPBCC family protein [Planctomycetales bacterium]